MTGAAVAVENVSRAFEVGGETVYALRDVSLTIAPGEFVAVIGRSGSGKTTLLNLIAGLDKPSSGIVRVDGQDVAHLSEQALTELRRKRIGFVFQSFGLLPLLSALENVELAMRIAGASRRERIARSHEVLELMGLGKRAHHRPYELSGGEQQRVAIARAIANRPSLILADEPTGELDSATAVSIFRLLREVARVEGITIITSTHDRMVMEMAGRVEELADGRLLSRESQRLFAYATQRGTEHFRAPLAEPAQPAAPAPPVDALVAGARSAQELPPAGASDAPPEDPHRWAPAARPAHTAAPSEALPEPEPPALPAEDINRWAPPERRT